VTSELALAPYALVDPLAQLEHAAELLAEARTAFDIPSKVAPVIAVAEAMRSLARQADLGLEAQNHAAAIKLRAERKAGELLADMDKQHGARGRGADLHDVSPPRVLADLGISHAQSHRWQAIASLPLPTFEDHIADAQDRGLELTSAGALRLAVGQHRAARASVSVPQVLLGARPSRVRLLVADVRAGLATLAKDQVQTVVTSVPYWGLRSYGTEPQVWGGDHRHVHKWTSVRPWVWCPGGGNYAKSTLSEGAQRRREQVEYKQGDSARCECGSWLGELGTEPTPELYVEHIVEVFRHVWRVLRKDGTVWLNIGFSYAGSGKGPTGWDGVGDQVSRQGFENAPVQGGLLGNRRVSGNQGRIAGARGYKAKDLIPIPWLVAMALQADGWYWRSTVAWCKKAPMPESVDDRPTSAWEPILLLSRSNRYFYDKEAVAEESSENTHARRANGAVSLNGKQGEHSDGVKANVSFHTATGDVLPSRNMRNVWLLGPEPFPGAHFAVFPTEVPRRCILAGSRPGDLVLDPFSGAGTTSLVAARLGRDSIGIDLKDSYVEMAADRIRADGGFTVDVGVQRI
jgi:DNA modification methylase